MGDRPIWLLQGLGGFSVNSIVIEGDDGLIVYDTGVSLEQGQAIAAAIKEISEKPIKVIIYSHHHADHCNGTDALITPEQASSGEVAVIAWESFDREHADENRVVGTIMGLRASFMYGAFLGPEEQSHTGLGGTFFGSRGTFIPPNQVISQDTEMVIAGIRLELFRTGGEASSEIGMDLPDYKTVVIADEVYPSLANLYTLRGAKFRDAGRWASASDRVLARDNVDLLLGCHMAPIEGQEQIRKVLTTYRDSIHFNHDQAVRLILQGATPDELRERLNELPESLDMAPYTRPMYGHVAANAAAQFTGYLGWFAGDATTLAPTPGPQRAERLVALAGGRDAVLAAGEAALAESDAQWAAELAAMLVTLDPADSGARQLKAAALRTLGYAELNATWRNWYLSGAKELDGEIDLAAIAPMARALIYKPELGAAAILDGLRYAVDPQVAGDQERLVGVDVVESGATQTNALSFDLRLRNAVLTVVADGSTATTRLTISVEDLARIVAGLVDLPELLEDGSVTCTGAQAEATDLFEGLDTHPAAPTFHVK